MLPVGYIQQLLRPLIAGCLLLITAFAFVHISFATEGLFSSASTGPDSGFISPSQYAAFVRQQEVGRQEITANSSPDIKYSQQNIFSLETLRSLFHMVGILADSILAMDTNASP